MMTAMLEPWSLPASKLRQPNRYRPGWVQRANVIWRIENDSIETVIPFSPANLAHFPERSVGPLAAADCSNM
jgi:hypothetical protein